MNKISIRHIDHAHSDWLRALDFYKQEIGILKNRLTEVAGKNTSAEAMKEVEHFENQFKVQNDNIDRLTHAIRSNVVSIGDQLQENKNGYVDGTLLSRHNELKNQFTTEEHTVNELRHSFNNFAAAWM